MKDQKPLSSNPVRRFRETLRLSREAFCDLTGVALETLRSWEREAGSVMPRAGALAGILKLAKTNKYELTEEEIRLYVSKSRRQSGRRRG